MPEPTRIWTIRRFAELDSTNRYLLDVAREDAPEGLVAVADHQTAGRGRLDRTWEAPPGSSLLVSVLLRPSVPAELSHVLVMAAALSLADAVTSVAGFTPELKWPNDLMVGDRKLAGLLAEREQTAVVLGAGLNVSWATFPAELAETATACNLEVDGPVDRDEILEAYLDALARRLDALDSVPAEYRARLATLGRRVRVLRGDNELIGSAVDVRHTGELIVRDDSGHEHAITAADIIHLR